MVKHNCVVVSYKKSVVTLINGEKLPVTLTLVEVVKCRADVSMLVRKITLEYVARLLC